METVIIVILGIYAGVMTYLRATASKTVTLVDDKVLEVGEKVEPIIEFIKPKVTK